MVRVRAYNSVSCCEEQKLGKRQCIYLAVPSGEVKQAAAARQEKAVSTKMRGVLGGGACKEMSLGVQGSEARYAACTRAARVLLLRKTHVEAGREVY